MRTGRTFSTRLAFGLALACALGALPRAHAQDALAFASLDREAVEVGETVTWTVEALAVAPSEEEQAEWVEAMKALAPEPGPGWLPVGTPALRVRRTGDVLELTRAFRLRAVEAGDHTVPSVVLRSRVRTPELAARAYLASSKAEAATRSVVAVVAEGTVDGSPFRRAGSAFLVGGDALVTAYHVVAGARRVVVTLPNGRSLVTGRAWALDPERDVAVLAVDARRARDGGLASLALAPERDDEAGVAFSGGWPAAREDRAQTVTVGRRHPDLDLGDRRVRVSANPVRPGDSGGPLLDEQGRVLGVIVSGRSTDGDLDLLRQDVCLAADVLPAMRARQLAGAPVALGRALRELAQREPSARALDAVDAVRMGLDEAGHLERIAEAARLDPDDPVLQFLAGSVLEGAGDDRRARDAFEGATRAGYFPAAYALAHHHLRHGDAARADSLFAVVRHSGPYDQLGAMGAARAQVEQGRTREARAALGEVLAHDARFAPALYLLGLVELADGNEDLARALWVRLAPRPAWAQALRVPIETPILRPAALEPLPIMAARRVQ